MIAERGSWSRRFGLLSVALVALALTASGLPFVLDGFRLNGRVPSLEALIDADLAGTPVPIDRSVAGKHRHQGFSDLDVVTFPGV